MEQDKKSIYPFYRKQEEEPKETELELEVQECSHMILKLENLKKPFWLNLGANDSTKIKISAIHLKSEDVICELTRKPCILHNVGHVVYFLPHINYDYLERCPSSEDSTKKYKLEGIKREHMFYTAKISRLEE